MSDLVGNPEDRFSQNEAQINWHTCCRLVQQVLYGINNPNDPISCANIALNTLQKHADEIYCNFFTAVKNDNYQMKNCDVFLIFAKNSKAVLASTPNLCFRAKIRKIMYTPVNRSFYYIKVGCKGVYRGHSIFLLNMAFISSSEVENIYFS